jgi:hypothetical protein
MPVVYVAASKTLSDWGASVGISKSLYKIGLADDGKAAVADLNAGKVAAAEDWKLVKAAEAGDLDADTLDERLAAAEIVVDPNYYPKLRRASGVVRVRPETVENALLVEKAMANETNLTMKLKPADFADWLIRLVLR